MAVERRGKYLVLRLESGLSLLVHLRMTGSFGFEPTSHERAVLELDDGTQGRLPRRAPVRHLARARGRRARAVSRRRRTGRSRSARGSPRSGWLRDSPCAGRRSRRCSSTSASRPASGTSTPTRRSGGRASIRCGRRRASIADEVRRAAPRDPGGAPRGDRSGRDRRCREYRTPDGSRGGDAGGVPRLWTRRPAVPALRHDDREDAGRRARHLVLPSLPAAWVSRIAARREAAPAPGPT